MLKVLIVALASIGLASCASTSSGFLGVGGVTERVDSFTGKRVIETGEGFVYCPSSEGLLCDTRMTLRFLWAGGDSILVVAKLRDIKSIQAIQFNLGAEPITIRPAGTLTDFKSDVSRAGNTVYSTAESTQRFIVTTEFARSLLASPKALVRLELLNANYNQPGDFLRPTVAGQPAAASLLTELLNRIEKAAAPAAEVRRSTCASTPTAVRLRRSAPARHRSWRRTASAWRAGSCGSTRRSAASTRWPRARCHERSSAISLLLRIPELDA